jgi:hypothetical protein
VRQGLSENGGYMEIPPKNGTNFPDYLPKIFQIFPSIGQVFG